MAEDHFRLLWDSINLVDYYIWDFILDTNSLDSLTPIKFYLKLDSCSSQTPDSIVQTKIIEN